MFIHISLSSKLNVSDSFKHCSRKSLSVISALEAFTLSNLCRPLSILICFVVFVSLCRLFILSFPSLTTFPPLCSLLPEYNYCFNNFLYFSFRITVLPVWEAFTLSAFYSCLIIRNARHPHNLISFP